MSSSMGSAENEAIQMLRSLLVAHLGKRSVGDIACIMADPSTPFRLRASHARRYNDMLEAFEPIRKEDALVRDPSVHTSAAGAGFLPCAAVAAMYARAAYGALMRQGGGDGVSAFVSGAAKAATGKWNASDNLHAFLELVDIKAEDVLLSSWSEQTFEPAFVISLDHKLKWLVITIRGTCEWKALYTDMAAETCAVASGLAHEGITRAARWILAQIKHILAGALQLYPTYQVVCTGHSLGAAVAAVLTLLLHEGEGDESPAIPDSDQISIASSSGDAEHDEVGANPAPTTQMEAPSIDSEDPTSEQADEDDKKMMDSQSACNVVRHVDGHRRGALRNSIAYCFGTPPVMSPLLAQTCAPFIVSFARNNDYITRLSVLSVDRLVLELTESSAPRMMTDWFLSKIGIPDHLRSRNPRTRAFGDSERIPELLIPPGTLIHIDSKAPEANLYWAMPGLYNEMFICFHMFADHLPVLYVENLLQVIRHSCPWHAPKLVLRGLSRKEGIEHDVLNSLRTLINEQELSPDSVARLIAGSAPPQGLEDFLR